LGLEQFGLGHDRGSSHGATRIIRKAYFEHPDYVPLLHRAYGLWAKLEAASGHCLIFKTGLLLFGPPTGPVIAGVKRSAELHRLDIDEISPGEARKRFPGLAPADDMTALFEKDAGYLAVEKCVRAQIEQAIGHGAEILPNQAVRTWSADAGGVTVRTDRDTYRAGSLVICAGAWSGDVLRDLGLPLEVRRKAVFWFEADRNTYHVDAGFPTFCFDTADGFFYGFPVIGNEGMKVSQHSGGRVVDRADALDRSVHDDDLRPVVRFIQAHLPGVTTRVVKHSMCMYTMTRDEHFIIDRHPDHANVVITAGFSGHGFKFAPVVGAVAADLVEQGTTEEPIGFLSARRPAVGR
jgi:sarcosine oxidase